MTVVTQEYLFRFDGSRENDRFMELGREGTDLVFAGKELRLGPSPGWIPDYLRVTVEDEGERCRIAIIELEADAGAARIAARKYLPEPSQAILDTFLRYLERASNHCRSTADPRLALLERLQRTLVTSPLVRVVTVGCQRHSVQPVEELPLIDQGLSLPEKRRRPETDSTPARPLSGQATLSPIEHKHLFRTILVLDAVVRGWDKSGASLRAWRNSRTQPLRADLRRMEGACPQLRKLVLGGKQGVTVDLDEVARELSAIWAPIAPRPYAPSDVLRAIEQYLPVAAELSSSGPAQEAFRRARPILCV